MNTYILYMYNYPYLFNNPYELGVYSDLHQNVTTVQNFCQVFFSKAKQSIEGDKLVSLAKITN